ncbi:hypothetical protein AB0N92_16145 [Streptomyces sp. NPDC093248]|uniref:hypothetical protein n=1 Tax=Streptomyces sp. NPDC093248 TaxID=3155072 RepID=UPI00341724A2
MTDLHTSEAATGTGPVTAPRRAASALCATQITRWGIACLPTPEQQRSRLAVSPPS